MKYVPAYARLVLLKSKLYCSAMHEHGEYLQSKCEIIRNSMWWFFLSAIDFLSVSKAASCFRTGICDWLVGLGGATLRGIVAKPQRNNRVDFM
jgi:hypothetical protein